MAATRDRALEAAVRLVGTQGVRALTHARVDAAAGLPVGSTSNWFRTREALVTGVTVWIAEQERAELDAAAGEADSPDELTDALCRLIEDATGRHAVRTRARYALFFEVTAQTALPDAILSARSGFETWARDALARLDAPDPDAAARALLANAAGLIVNRLTVAPDAPIRSTLELTLHAALRA